MKKIIVTLLVLIGIAILGLAYLGVVPVLSRYLVHPVDLGIRPDPSLVTTFEAKHGMKNELPGGVVPAGREPTFTGSTSLDVTLSSSELTSILAFWKGRNSALPIRDVQVRINDDGTGEVSGILEIKTALAVARSLGYSDQDIARGQTYVQYVAGDLPFYVKGVGSVVNNQVTLAPSTFSLGRVNVPESITKLAALAVSDMIERRLTKVGGIDIREFSLGQGQVHLVGRVPDTIK